jgi:DNA repair exonuclease SbcCD ATPase subunit
MLWIAVTAVATAGVAVPEARAEAPQEAPAAPRSVASLIGELEAEQANETRLREEAEAAVRPNGALAAERRLYEQQLQTRLAPIEKAIVEDIKQLGAAIDKHNAGVQRSNAGCSGTVSRPVHERCQGEKRHWDASKARLDQRKDALQQRAIAFEKQVQPYTKRLAEIAAQIDRNEEAAAKARRALAETQARILALKALLAEACKGNAEAIKHCGDVRWSGADPKLPELKRRRPPFVATPNR